MESYRSTAGLVRTLTVLLTTCAVLGVLAGVLSVVLAVLVPDAERAEQPWEIGLLLGVGCEALAYMVVFYTTVVVFAMFVHRACRNAHALGALGMEFTPGWAVGWYFVPFANLFKPFQAMREIFHASDPTASAGGWASRPTPPLLGWWWAAWLTSNILGNLILRVSLSSAAVSAPVAAGLDVVDGLLDVALTVLAVRVVRTVAARQEQKARVAAFA
jgi:uncharacterized protein DUF4328